jgi:hypothetical protein
LSPRTTPTLPPSVDFDTALSFDALTRRALRLAEEERPLYAALLRLLEDCEEAHEGPLERQQRRGASYRSLAAVAHLVEMGKDDRVRWYKLAERVPLSQRHCGHLLAKLKRAES